MPQDPKRRQLQTAGDVLTARALPSGSTRDALDGKLNVLHVLENDYFPRDARILNEARVAAKLGRCFVLAPRGHGESFLETTYEGIAVVRFPHFEANGLRTLAIEYLCAALWIALLVPVIVLVRRINVIHVANPPDFVVPLLCWLRLFGVRFVYDVHDISTETLKGKMSTAGSSLRALLPVLGLLERASAQLSDLCIATNETIAGRMTAVAPSTPVHVVRNSNLIRYDTPSQTGKAPREGCLHIGYFGVIANDAAAGLDNIVLFANTLARRGQHFRFSIIGSGPGLARLRQLVREAGLEAHFSFLGYLPLPQAFEVIKEFDFGLVSWGDLPKNHMHTAMKVMDYMCCAVPVCSLELKEQLRSTAGVGIHAARFEDLADRTIRTYADVAAYEHLRHRTLQRFNEVLSWPAQQTALLAAYDVLLGSPSQRSTKNRKPGSPS
jgi:glycosyltransferase involved in cell wall biosynthesis